MLIKELLERNEIYTDASNSILAQCKGTLDDVFENVVESKMNIKWTSIDFHPTNQLLLNVMGVATYRVGEKMTSESGDTVYIDATNVENYTRMMRFMLPLSPVDRGEISLIIQFLKEYSKLIEVMPQDHIESMVGDIMFLKDNFSLFSDKFKDVKIVSPDMYEGFDLNELDLDEDQLKQLKLLRPEGQS